MAGVGARPLGLLAGVKIRCLHDFGGEVTAGSYALFLVLTESESIIYSVTDAINNPCVGRGEAAKSNGSGK